MSTVELIHQQVDSLPESAQLALLEYIEFLQHKYHINETEDPEREQLMQKLIFQRYEHYRQNPIQKSQHQEDFHSKITSKYGW
ncbi:MAG: hypothetical protein U0Y10_02850 [Spirosomataceae bacterium]